MGNGARWAHVAAELCCPRFQATDEAAKALALSLTSNTSIVKLNLSDNGLDGDGAVAMAEMLKENCYISELDLSENKVGVKGTAALSTVLQENPILVSLKLSGNELNDRAAKYLADALVTNQKVEHLDLSHNRLGEPAGEALGVAMAENVGLKQLNLSWNNFRGRGAVAVAKGLGVGKGTLFEGNNRIALEGALALALGLKGNKNLRRLQMSRNPIQNEGCLGILKAIRANPGAAMEFLDFSDGRSPEHPVLRSPQPSICARQEMFGISVCPGRLRLWLGAVFETDRNGKVVSSQSHAVLLTVLVPVLGCRTPIRGAASWGTERTLPSSTEDQGAEMAGQALPFGGQ
ncbi:hypothetical protein Chor_000016, partial [Crotalus horridus]